MKRLNSLASLSFALSVVACGAQSSSSTSVPEPAQAPDNSSAAKAPQASSKSSSLELAFITHLDANLPEQDVFIERKPGSGEVYRVTKGDHDMSAPLYAAARFVKHNPFDPKAIGPYPRGEALGMDLGTWLGQRGRGSYTCEEGVATLDVSFEGLVPRGVYTMWHAFMALPPTDPFSGTLDLPLGVLRRRQRKRTVPAHLLAVPCDVRRLDHVDARHQLPQRWQDLQS